MLCPERESETGGRDRESRICPACRTRTRHRPLLSKAGARKRYPPPFEEFFWRDYPTDALMSKSKAFEKWQRLGADDRAAAQAALPGFRAHCAKDLTYRPVHAERFLSQRRFDGFVETPAPDAAALRALWGGRAAALIEAIGAAKFAAWFADAVLDEGPPPVLRVGKPFAAKWIGEPLRGRC